MEDQPLGTCSLADIAHALTQNVQHLLDQEPIMTPVEELQTEDFNRTLSATLQELSLRLSQMSGKATRTSSDSHQERRQLVQKSRQALAEAIASLKENARDAGLASSLRGCLIALRAAEHLAAQRIVAAGHPVFQTLAILEKSSSSSDRLVLNIKLLGMRLTKFLELCGRNVHDLRGPRRRARVQMHVHVINKLLPFLVHSLENAIHRPMNAYCRASRDLFFALVKQSTEAVVKLFCQEDLDDCSEVGKFIQTVDSVLEQIDAVKSFADFEAVQRHTEWLITFAMTVAKASRDEKDIINGCHHIVNELTNLKEALNSGDAADLVLAKEVAKDFVEVTEQSVNTALLKLIVLSLSQLHVPLDRLIHAILSSDKSLPDRSADDLTDLVEAADNHADVLFHIAHFATFCTSDSATAQSITNGLHLAQLLEKELVPACLKLYFNPEDAGARGHLKTLRQLWRTELDCLESSILDIVDPTAFCVVVETEARRIASIVKKDQYSQDRDWLRLSVSQVVRLCQMAVDFAWKEMTSNKADPSPNRLPEDHPIIRVERSTWEVQAALKMVIASVEDLHVHKVMIRRVQLMVTCTTAMVECLVDANKTEQVLAAQSAGVKVLTSVSRISISFQKADEEDGGQQRDLVSKSSRVLGKSFKNITMNNTIGVGMKLNVIDIPITSLVTSQDLKATVAVSSRKMVKSEDEIDAIEQLANAEANNPVMISNDENPKSVFRKVKLHSNSMGFRSPLKQINNQLLNKTCH